MKLTIIGAGNVGSQAAFYAALRQLGDIVILDLNEEFAKGKALDMLESMPIAGSNVNIIGTSNYEDTKDSDIVIITAGLPRKPGMSRDDLLEANSNIIKAIVPEVVKNSPNTILIIVTNPLDAMVQLAYKISNFPKQRVLGMAGVLDTARFRTFVAQETKADVNKIQAMVLGGHGDLMVPLINHCKVDDKPLSEVLDKEKIDKIIERTRKGGIEIVDLLKTGSAFFAPGLAVIQMAESILKDEKKVLPCAALLEGEYGETGIFAGVPVKLGKGGAEEIIELELTPEEKAAFSESAKHVKELVSKL